MRLFLRLGFSFVAAAALASCATAGAKQSVQRELSLTLLSPSQTKKIFMTRDAPNPFIDLSKVHITTLPRNFLTASLFLPKGVKSVDVEELSLYSADEQFITGAMTKKELINYWNSMGFDSSQRDSMLRMIDQYYLPESPITGSSLGREYAIVFLTQDPVESTDHVTATIKIDEEVKSFDLPVGDVVVPAKKRK
jgi:hypothetical protein